MDKDAIIDKICRFLTGIGLPFAERALPHATFLPGLAIDNGVLIIDRDRLLYPGDILHEAGHIAVAAPAQRQRLSDNVQSDDAYEDGQESAAVLWSYFAALAGDIPPELVFHPDGYKGDSQWLLDHFRQGTYIGLPLLVYYGILAQDPPETPRVVSWWRR